MAEIKNENFIAIQAFMVKKLDLTGNELIAYALIYGFSQDGESRFKGSLSYVADWLNCSRTTAFNLLSKLADDGFVKKTEKFINGVKLCDYSAVVPSDDELEKIKVRKQQRKEAEKSKRCSKNLNTHSKSCNTHSKNLKGCSKNLNGGVQKVGTHNILDNITDNNINNIADNIDKVNTSDLSDVKVNTFPVGKGEAKKLTRKQLEEKQSDMINRFDNICNDNLSANPIVKDCIKKVFTRYIVRYNNHTDKIHPILKDETLLRIALILAGADSGGKSLLNEIETYTPYGGTTMLEDMVDLHFLRKHRQETDWSIVHFANAEYLDKLASGLI